MAHASSMGRCRRSIGPTPEGRAKGCSIERPPPQRASPRALRTRPQPASNPLALEGEGWGEGVQWPTLPAWDGAEARSAPPQRCGPPGRSIERPLPQRASPRALRGCPQSASNPLSLEGEGWGEGGCGWSLGPARLSARFRYGINPRERRCSDPSLATVTRWPGGWSGRYSSRARWKYCAVTPFSRISSEIGKPNRSSPP